MSRVTVVNLIHTIPNRRDELVGITAEQLRREATRLPARIDAYLFEDDESPGRFMYIGRWSNRTALEAYRVSAPDLGTPDWYASPTEVRVYAPLKTYTLVYVPSEVADALIIEGPAEAHAGLRAALKAYDTTLAPRAQGIVELEASEGLDRPGQFLILVRWRSGDDRLAFRTTRSSQFYEILAGLGGSIRRFVGGGCATAASPTWTPRAPGRSGRTAWRGNRERRAARPR